MLDKFKKFISTSDLVNPEFTCFSMNIEIVEADLINSDTGDVTLYYTKCDNTPGQLSFGEPGRFSNVGCASFGSAFTFSYLMGGVATLGLSSVQGVGIGC